LLLSVPLSSDQSADFCNCLIDLIEQPPARFELRRKVGGDEGRVVRSLESHAANDTREAKSGAVLNYRADGSMKIAALLCCSNPNKVTPIKTALAATTKCIRLRMARLK